MCVCLRVCAFVCVYFQSRTCQQQPHTDECCQFSTAKMTGRSHTRKYTRTHTHTHTFTHIANSPPTTRVQYLGLANHPCVFSSLRDHCRTVTGKGRQVHEKKQLISLRSSVAWCYRQNIIPLLRACKNPKDSLAMAAACYNYCLWQLQIIFNVSACVLMAPKCMQDTKPIQPACAILNCSPFLLARARPKNACRTQHPHSLPVQP